ncbi:MAG: hypothetical protein LUE99_06240 [Bacteroides sp.]|nr:hypothetical protein [Bacteroides sp.]
MKQMKFLMVAFTLLMGISFSSCMGDSDPNVTQTIPLKLVGTYPYTFQFPNDGLKIVATNTSELMASSSENYNYGDIVYITFTYNTDEQPVTENTKEVNARVIINYNTSKGTSSVMADNNGAGEPYENATIVDLASGSEGTMYFDKNTLMLGVTFLAKSDVFKHTFVLVYDESAEKEDGIMKLYLRHTNSEDTPTQQSAMYRTFNISRFLDAFGETPNKIRVYANETNKSDSCSLDDAQKELQFVEIEYKSIFDK